MRLQFGIQLSASEITEIYNSGSPTDLTSDAGNYTSSSNLQGYWRFEDNTKAATTEPWLTRLEIVGQRPLKTE